MKFKKAQFLFFGIILLILLSSFIYYLENKNTYKLNYQNIDMFIEFENEICNFIKSSNYSYIESDLDKLITNLNSLCLDFKMTCEASFVKVNSNQNYVDYDVFLNISYDDFYIGKIIKC